MAFFTLALAPCKVGPGNLDRMLEKVNLGSSVASSDTEEEGIKPISPRLTLACTLIKMPDVIQY